jgi:galactose-1-phosphate uridylyltransferase
MALHQAPTDDGLWQPVSHLQLELTPAQRTGDLPTFPSGPELAAGAFEIGVSPEAAAGELRQALLR